MNDDPIKPGYKHTERGVIPEDWEVASLGAISSVSSGGTPSRSNSRYWGGDVPWVTTTEVDFSIITETREAITQDGLRNSAAKVFPKDTLLMALYGQGKTRGKIGILGIDAATNQACAAISVDRSVSRKFVFYFLAGQYEAIRKLSNTGNQENLNSSLVRGIVICLPPSSEQHAIAEVLSDVDALLDALDRLIAKKRAIKQGAMQALLTGRVRLPGFSGVWNNRRIAEIASPTSEKNTAGEKLPVLTCSKHLGFMDSLSYFKNQVFSDDTTTYKLIRRGQIGYPANHIEEGSIGYQDLYDVALVSPIYVVFSANENVCGDFLHKVLKLGSYRQKFKQETSSSVDRRGSLRWPVFSEITVELPTYEEQIAIAEVLSGMDAEIEALEKRRSKLRAIKQGMMQELLTGRIRLVQPQEQTQEAHA